MYGLKHSDATEAFAKGSFMRYIKRNVSIYQAVVTDSAIQTHREVKQKTNIFRIQYGMYRIDMVFVLQPQWGSFQTLCRFYGTR